METRTQPSFFSLLNPRGLFLSMWAHRELLWQFTVRNLELRHKGSVLGFAWAVLNPLLMLALYVFVFRFILGGTFGVVPDETKWDYGLGVFLSLSFFHLIAETVSVAPTLIVTNPNFVKKVVFPLEVLPAAAVGSAVIHMLISLTMVMAGVFLVGRGVSGSVLYLPLVIVPAVMFSLGTAWLIAALGVFFRDIGQFVGAVVTGLMFASAIFYPAARIQEVPGAWSILRFNPVIHIVETARSVVLWREAADPGLLLWLNLSCFAFAVLGYACFSRLKRAFADVV